MYTDFIYSLYTSRLVVRYCFISLAKIKSIKTAHHLKKFHEIPSLQLYNSSIMK